MWSREPSRGGLSVVRLPLALASVVCVVGRHFATWQHPQLCYSLWKGQKVPAGALLWLPCPGLAYYSRKKESERRFIVSCALQESTSLYALEWWGANKTRYPMLSQLAARYLSIPATPVPCELFSIAGHIIVNEKKACLLPSDVNMLVFLAENLQ